MEPINWDVLLEARRELRKLIADRSAERSFDAGVVFAKASTAEQTLFDVINHATHYGRDKEAERVLEQDLADRQAEATHA